MCVRTCSPNREVLVQFLVWQPSIFNGNFDSPNNPFQNLVAFLAPFSPTPCCTLPRVLVYRRWVCQRSFYFDLDSFLPLEFFVIHVSSIRIKMKENRRIFNGRKVQRLSLQLFCLSNKKKQWFPSPVVVPFSPNIDNISTSKP